MNVNVYRTTAAAAVLTGSFTLLPRAARLAVVIFLRKDNSAFCQRKPSACEAKAQSVRRMCNRSILKIRSPIPFICSSASTADTHRNRKLERELHWPRCQHSVPVWVGYSVTAIA